jgi:hypothetical protein
MNVSDAQRVRSLEEENGKLKRLLADAMLDKAALIMPAVGYRSARAPAQPGR